MILGLRRDLDLFRVRIAAIHSVAQPRSEGRRSRPAAATQQVLRYRPTTLHPGHASRPHSDGSRPDRSAEIEGKYLRTRITAKLQRHQRQQHRFTSARRTDHQRMTDVTDMERKPERGRALGLSEQQRRRREVMVPTSPAQTADSGII